MEFNEVKKDFKKMSHNGPVVGVVLILAGLLIGWFTWGVHKPVNKDVIYDNEPAGIVSPATTPAVAPAAALAPDMTMSLSDKTGTDFDKAFLDQMIKNHETDIAMAKLVLQKSTRQDLIAIAGEIISNETKEIQQMKQWQQNWFQ